MKVCITKYALSQGPYWVEAESCGESTLENASMVKWNEGRGLDNYAHGFGREWHISKVSAVARCETMRTAKIASLRKAIKKLEALNFEAML